MTTAKKAHELKALQGQRDRLQIDLDQAKGETAKALAFERRIRADLTSTEQRIARISRMDSEPIVSEHALLRYLERVKGIDLQEISREILTPQRVLAIKALGTLRINMEGVSFVVRNGVVVTTEEKRA